MKREELKEWIELYFEDFMSPSAVEHSTNQFMEKIDEYTKPKTKKKSLDIEARNLIEDFDKKVQFLRWTKYRKQLGKSIKVKETINRLAKKFNDTDIETITQVVNHSIDNQYQGLFWDKFKSNGNKPTTTQNRNATEDDINNYINS
jgi:hypothetical protein